MERALIDGEMAVSMKVILKMGRSTAKENSSNQLEKESMSLQANSDLI
jgi:hypothetical protein